MTIAKEGVSISEGEFGVAVLERQTHLSPFLNNAFQTLKSRRHLGIITPEKFIAQLKEYIPAYIRWETARRSQSQPFLDPSVATAYEPYLLNLYDDPVFVVQHLLTNVREVLDAANDDIGSDLSHVLNVLEGKEFSIPALQYGEQMFLALREITLSDGMKSDKYENRGARYQQRVHELVEQRGDMQFMFDNNGVTQRIVLPEQKDIVQLTNPRLSREKLEALTKDQKSSYSWRVIDLIGQVGHPVSRDLLLDVETNKVEEDMSHDERRYHLFVARMNARNAGIPDSELPKVPLIHG